jgi:hypothetical protein
MKSTSDRRLRVSLSARRDPLNGEEFSVDGDGVTTVLLNLANTDAATASALGGVVTSAAGVLGDDPVVTFKSVAFGDKRFPPNHPLFPYNPVTGVPFSRSVHVRRVGVPGSERCAGSDVTALNDRERSFMMNPDHPTSAPGTKNGREAHGGRIHFQIGPTATQAP